MDMEQFLQFELAQERAFDLINIDNTENCVEYWRYKNFNHSSGIDAECTQYTKRKRRSGRFDDLIRISVGIEDVEDLIEDFKHALK